MGAVSLLSLVNNLAWSGGSRRDVSVGGALGPAAAVAIQLQPQKGAAAAAGPSTPLPLKSHLRPPLQGCPPGLAGLRHPCFNR